MILHHKHSFSILFSIQIHFQGRCNQPFLDAVSSRGQNIAGHSLLGKNIGKLGRVLGQK